MIEALTPPDQVAAWPRISNERAMRAEIRQRRYTERHPQSPLCLGIRPHVYGALRRANIRTIDLLAQLTPEQVRDAGVSTASVGDIFVALDRYLL